MTITFAEECFLDQVKAIGETKEEVFAEALKNLKELASANSVEWAEVETIVALTEYRQRRAG